jgi:hypothetical protein
MDTTEQLDLGERERIRLRFFREHADLAEFSSVSVRRHPETSDWCVYVGLTGDADLPSTFEGLPVASYRTGVAVHAVAYHTV